MTSVEHSFGSLIESALLRFRLVAEQLRAHHRRKRQRNHRRDQNRDRQSDRELAEQASDDVAHEEQWNQDRDQRNRQRNDRESDLIGTLQRGLKGRIAFFEIPDDVLDHDDRVIHHETGGNRERHEREIVQAVAAQGTSLRRCQSKIEAQPRSG